MEAGEALRERALEALGEDRLQRRTDLIAAFKSTFQWEPDYVDIHVRKITIGSYTFHHKRVAQQGGWRPKEKWVWIFIGSCPACGKTLIEDRVDSIAEVGRLIEEAEKKHRCQAEGD